MKILYIILSLVFLPFFLHSQVVFMENFENLSCSSDGNDCFDFPLIAPTCFEGGATHGTPHITTDGGDAAVWIGEPEGLFINLPTIPSSIVHSISLSFKIRFAGGASFANFKISLGTDVIHDNSSCSGTAPNFSNEIIIDEISVNSENGEVWLDYTKNFCSGGLDQLLIIPQQNGAQDFVLLVDNIIISQEGCSDNITFNSPSSFLPNMEQRKFWIKTELNSGNSTSFIRNAPGTMTIFKAGEFILFKPQTLLTVANQGDFFLAKIEDCDGVGGINCPLPLVSNSSIKRRFLKSNLVSIYPNPSERIFKLILEEELFLEYKTYSVHVFNVLGEIVYQDFNINYIEELEMSNIQNGTYTLVVKDDKNIPIFHEKIIKF